MDGSKDELIKPQGCTQLPVVVPNTVDLAVADPTDENFEVMTPEEQDGLITAEDEAIHLGDDDINEDEDVIIEDHVSDEEPDEEMSDAGANERRGTQQSDGGGR